MYSPERPPERKPQLPRNDGPARLNDDDEVIAYFQAQRQTTKSREWAACLDAMIRDLQK